MGVRVREKTKGSGVFWIFIKHQNRGLSKKIGSESLALDVAEKLRARLAMNPDEVFNKEQEPVPLFCDYAKCWLADYIKPLRRHSTYLRYQHVLAKYVNLVLGDKPLDQIGRGDVRDMLLKYYKTGLSASSVCIMRDVVSGVMGYALDEELIDNNPVRGISKKLNLNRRRLYEVTPMTKDEVDHVLTVCCAQMPEHYLFFLCAFRTGMRLGELLGLKWADIDWGKKRIRVERSFKGGRVSTTKTGRIRAVDMSAQLEKTLRIVLSERQEQALAKGQVGVEDFIFQRDGQPIAQNSIRNFWRRLLKLAELPYRRFHEVRHTFASLLLSDGQSPVYVKEQLGHSSIQMTVDIYGHLIPSSNREAVNRLDHWDVHSFNIRLLSGGKS